MTIAVHRIVAKAAKGIASAFYEEAAHDNAFFRVWPDRRAFVRKCWGKFIDPARESLVKCLASNGLTTEQKNEIYVALLQDGALNPTLEEAKVVHGVAEPLSLAVH